MIKDSAVPDMVLNRQNRHSLWGQPRLIKNENGLEYLCWVRVNPYLLFLILILLILSFDPPFQVVAYPIPA